MIAISIARIASLIGDAARIRMLTLLLDGNGHSASELAMAAAVSPQTASSHLSKLLSGGLIVCEPKGRQRLFQLRDRDVATAVEALGSLAHTPQAPAISDLRFARTCYDHLAGVLAIALRDEFLRKGLLCHAKAAFTVTPAGRQLLCTLDIDSDALSRLRRSFARECLDWTERQHHLGGSLGATLLCRFVERKWLALLGTSRAVRITHAGEKAFEELFGIRCRALRPHDRTLRV